MFEFWREATATSVRGLICQSGRRRPENVSILSSLISVTPSETLARDWLNTNERQEMVMSTITLMNTIYNLSEKNHIDWDCDVLRILQTTIIDLL